MEIRRWVPGWAAGRVRQLPSSRLTLLLDACVLLLCARVALAIIPVRYIFAWKQRPLAQTFAYTPAELRYAVRLVAWSVERISQRSPIRFVCFPQCLAAISLLRRSGIESRLHYGVSRVDGKLVTHAWLEAGGEVLVGLEACAGFSTLHVY
jgi:hypothetical protein